MSNLDFELLGPPTLPTAKATGPRPSPGDLAPPPGTATPTAVPKPRGFLDPGPPEYAPGDPRSAQSIEMFGPPPEPKHGIERLAWDRALGADIEHDPQSLPRLSATILGAITLGVASAPYGPVPAAIGAAAGATIGASSPELLMEIGESIGTLPKGTRERYGLSDRDLITVMRGEALLELITGGGVTLARGAGREFTGFLTGVNTAGQSYADAALAQKARDLGINLLPVQVGDRTIARNFVNVFGRMPWLGGPFKAQAKKTEEELKAVMGKLPERLAPLALGLTDVSRQALDDAAATINRVNDVYTRRFTDLFNDAEMFKIRVQPANALVESEDILADINRMSPVTGAGQTPMQGSESLQAVKNFINTKIMPMMEDLPKTVRPQAQSLQAIDTLISQLDKFELGLMKQTFEPGSAAWRSHNEALSQLDRLRVSIMQDTLTSALEEAPNQVAGKATKYVQLSPAGQAIIQRFHDTSNEMATVMADLVDTATAKRMGLTRSGARGQVGRAVTTTPEDNIAQFVLQTESPQMVGELQALVDPPTFKNIAAAVVRDKIELSMKVHPSGAGKQFNVDEFVSQFALDKPSSGKYKQLEELLNRAGGLTMDEVKTLAGAAQKMAEVPIPDVSSFVARKAALGTLKGALASTTGVMLLGGAVGGIGARASGEDNATTGASAVMLGLAFLGGSRLIAAAISNPLSAQALRTVMKEEASLTVRRAAAAKATRIAIWSLQNNGWTRDQVLSADNEVSDTIKGIWDTVEGAAKKVGAAAGTALQTAPPAR